MCGMMRRGVEFGGIACLTIALALAFFGLPGEAVAGGPGCGAKGDPPPATPLELVTAGERTGDTELAPGEAPAGGTPQFKCAETTSTVKPSWTGKPVVGKWVVSNTGTANLTLKIKGG
ncbi:MAG: hypothetical protein GY842_26675 [bacterium]|nr:hypothetical protein [bacterium]